MESSVTPLRDVPAHQRHRILSGMRWTVWLSVIAVPFSAAINLLLARVGPEAIGVYGLLGVYIGLITSWFYFGGDSVVMRFIPDCRQEDRAAFLLSYSALILPLLVGWVALAYCWPAATNLVLGDVGGNRFHLIILCLTPVPISFAMIVASLKGMLEIRLAQLLNKLLAIISFLTYAAVFIIDRPLLIAHPAEVVWSIYLGLMAVLALIGAVYVIRLCGASRLRFYLPTGFWRYTASTQMVSSVNFLSGRLDYLLILNFGGLDVLGRYVAVMTVAASVLTVSGFFMETLLPSLTNMIASRNDEGAAQVFMMHMRILFLVTTAMGCAIMVLAEPASELLGPQYHSTVALIILMAMFQSVSGPGYQGGTLLASVGRQQRAVGTGILNIISFAGLFILLWHRWNLAGAVVAYGVAAVISRAALMAIARRSARIFPSILGLWLKAAAVQLVVCIIALWRMPLGFIEGISLWLGAMALFLRLSRYGLVECKTLVGTFTPGVLRQLGKRTNAAHSEAVEAVVPR